MNRMLLSIVIPAHNAEMSIVGTVQSIEREFQGKIDYEIIVVENGSTDQTSQIVEKLAEQNNAVKLFHSEKGVSNARNAGISCALGEWLMFVDADDELHMGCGKRLKEIMQNSEADLCFFSYLNGQERRLVCDQEEVYEGNEIEKARIRLLEAPTRYMQVWSKLFRRQQVIDHSIWFENELKFAEDSDFTFQYTAVCHSITFYPDILYDYKINSESVMHTFDAKKIDAYVQAMMVMKGRMVKESPAIQQACQQYILAHFHIAMVNGVFEADNSQSFRKKVNEIRCLAAKPVFADTIRQVKVNSGGMVATVTSLLLKGHLYGLLGMVYTLRGWQKRNSKDCGMHYK